MLAALYATSCLLVNQRLRGVTRGSGRLPGPSWTVPTNVGRETGSHFGVISASRDDPSIPKHHLTPKPRLWDKTTRVEVFCFVVACEVQAHHFLYGDRGGLYCCCTCLTFSDMMYSFTAGGPENFVEMHAQGQTPVTLELPEQMWPNSPCESLVDLPTNSISAIRIKQELCTCRKLYS